MSAKAVDLSLPEGLLKDRDISELEQLSEDEAHFVEFFSNLELDSVSCHCYPQKYLTFCVLYLWLLT